MQRSSQRRTHRHHRSLLAPHAPAPGLCKPVVFDSEELRSSPARNDWRARDLVEERPTITLRGARYTGHGLNVLGDPRVALAWLANELRELGLTLKTGEVVSTGTCHAPLPIQSGDELVADFGDIGRVSVKIA